VKHKIFIFSIVFLLVACTSDPLAEANEFATAKNYIAAANTLIKAAADNPEMADKYLSWACYYRLENGQRVYSRNSQRNITSAVSAYTTNYEKVLELLPETIDSEAKRPLSGAFLAFAETLDKSEAPNSVLESQWERTMLDAVDDAAMVDPANPDINAFKAAVYADKFNAAKSKGDEYFNTARQKRSDYDYLLAERFYAYALKFEPENGETKDLLSKVRDKTLSIWNPQDDLLIAVVDEKKIGEYLWLGISLKNNTDIDVDFDPGNYSLVLKDGSSLRPDLKKMSEDKNAFKAMQLEALAEKAASLYFPWQGGSKNIDYLSYSDSNGKETRKFFP
jgi:hypothetical protein